MEENSVSEELLLSENAKAHLNTIAKWVYIMSIIALTIMIFLILRFIYDDIKMSNWDDVPAGGGVGYILIMEMSRIFYIICSMIFFPLYFLFKFSASLKMALECDDSDSLEMSFKYLKFHYLSIVIVPLCYIAYIFVASIF
ncbi:hypothetical protein SAMN06265349_105246 [Flavobacterium resistens]|uniref:Uncharacterized protein n=1 Tax=Flavobacterium resistens TaxID=443612 RepID=A0A521ERV0_9FLAO|nr:hypothetical protein [Flavobacterium resistens]MRX67869.1 hypothetical protein [Flavobacterium resistens]SMO86141.1 hypothetical protein SAMN06265349_105246 [Flavobacterium resistens]